MVGTGVQMGLYPCGDSCLVSPRHDGVDESVAAGRLEVLVGVAQGPQIVGVVGELQVPLAKETARFSGRGRVGLDEDSLLGRQQRAGAEQGPGRRSVFRWNEVRM